MHYEAGQKDGSTSIYIVLMHSGTFPSKIVRFFTRYPYSHAALSLTARCDTLYSFGRRSLRNFLDGGFTCENRDGAFFSKYKDTSCCVYRLYTLESQYHQLESGIAHFIAHQDDYRYDFLGAFLRFFRIPVWFPNRFVCSSFVAKMLTDAGICSFPKHYSMVRPEDFPRISGIVSVYEGKYRCMNNIEVR